MSETPRLKLPLLDAAQAQKHVTLNEAITRTDALASARVESRALTVAPAGAVDGEAYIVGSGSTGEWAGRDGDLTLYLNGGWDFVTPWSGLTVWVEAERTHVTFDDGQWVAGRTGGAAGGAVTLTKIAEIDHDLGTGSSSTTPTVIPDKAIVLGVTARVIEEVTGASAWSLGVPGSTDRYGTSYGTALNSFAQGVTGQPQAYFGDTALEITAEGGTFTGGRIRLAIHYADLTPPNVV